MVQQALVLLSVQRTLELDVDGARAGSLEDVEEALLHRLGAPAMLRALDEIHPLLWIGLEVLQLIPVPQPVVEHELVAILTQREHRRSMRIVVLPVIGVDERRTPVRDLRRGQKRKE